MNFLTTQPPSIIKSLFLTPFNDYPKFQIGSANTQQIPVATFPTLAVAPNIPTSNVIIPGSA